MPVSLTKYERHPGVDRNEFALAALNFCRTRRLNPKIQSARFYWVDGGNTVGFIVQGEPGCFDYNPNPNPEAQKAMFALTDLGSMKSTETWAEAGLGERTWDLAGRPTGKR